MTKKDFLEVRELISIAHHLPGRIRLKFEMGILFHPASKTLSSLSGGKPGTALLDARLNLAARSLVLEYDTERMSPEDLEDFLAGNDAARAELLAEKVAALLGLELLP